MFLLTFFNSFKNISDFNIDTKCDKLTVKCLGTVLKNWHFHESDRPSRKQGASFFGSFVFNGYRVPRRASKKGLPVVVNHVRPLFLRCLRMSLMTIGEIFNNLYTMAFVINFETFAKKLLFVKGLKKLLNWLY